MTTSILLASYQLRLAPASLIRGGVCNGVLRNLTHRTFHSARSLRSDVHPDFPEDLSKVPKVRKPGRFAAEPLRPPFRIGNAPIYTAPAGPQVAFTKRSTLGFAAIGAYVGYLCSVTTGISPYATLFGMFNLKAF